MKMAVPWNEKICCLAARNGHLHILQYAHANGCPWDKRTCQFAAANGHLHILQYAHINGCPWDASACASAAENGHLAVLQWAHGKCYNGHNSKTAHGIVIHVVKQQKVVF
jgi:hypothetical protein